VSTAPASIAQAVATVVASWETNRTQSPYTTEKYSSVLSRFVRFAEAHGIVALAQVDAALVEAFVHSLGRDRCGRVSRVVSGRTRVNRLSALRAFYAAVISAGWVESNPTADIAVPSRGAPSHNRVH